MSFRDTWRLVPPLMKDALTVYVFSVVVAGIIGGLASRAIRIPKRKNPNKPNKPNK